MLLRIECQKYIRIVFDLKLSRVPFLSIIMHHTHMLGLSRGQGHATNNFRCIVVVCHLVGDCNEKQKFLDCC